MCLLVIAWRQHAEFPFIAAGNRDEYHSRPTREAHWWPDDPDIVGGRDLQAAGSWLALHRDGRFAAVTNYQDAKQPSKKGRSRGHLVTDFLRDNASPMDFANDIDADNYSGFNLLLCDGDSLAWRSNRSDGTRTLAAGIYGLSNALLDSPWPKVVRSKARLSSLINENQVNESRLFRLLDDRTKAAVDDVDSQGLPFETAHSISAPFIVMPDYGTRSSSIALMNNRGTWQFREKRFDAAGRSVGESGFHFDAQE